MQMNAKSMLSALAMVGCGDDGGNRTDVLIIVPDSGRTDTLDTDGFVGDQGGDRDVSSGDDTSDMDVSATDQGGTDTNVNDSVEPTDEGQDLIEDAAPRCSLGKAACNSASANRMTCATASVLGRVTLSTDNGISGYNDTINEGVAGGPNKDDDNLDDDGCPGVPDAEDPLWCQSECDDDGPDHFFKVYLIQGDLFSFTVSNWRVVEHPDFMAIDFMLKVYKGDCQLDRNNLLSCVNAPISETQPANNNVQIKPLSEEEEGWYTIVLDSTGSDHAGTYDFEARLFQNSEYTGDWNLCCDYPLE